MVLLLLLLFFLNNDQGFEDMDETFLRNVSRLGNKFRGTELVGAHTGLAGEDEEEEVRNGFASRLASTSRGDPFDIFSGSHATAEGVLTRVCSLEPDNRKRCCIVDIKILMKRCNGEEERGKHLVVHDFAIQARGS